MTVYDPDRRREELNRAYGDAVYDAWRQGLDSDRITREDVSDRFYECYDTQEAARMAVEDLRQRSTGPTGPLEDDPEP